MPRRLRIGYARAVRMSGDGTTYAIAEQAAGTYVDRKVAAGQASYAVAGQDAALNSTAGGDITWSAATGATGYNVYWDTLPGPPYANVLDVGNVLGVDYAGFPGIGTGLRYFNIRSYDESDLEGPYGVEIERTLT